MRTILVITEPQATHLFHPSSTKYSAYSLSTGWGLARARPKDPLPKRRDISPAESCLHLLKASRRNGGCPGKNRIPSHNRLQRLARLAESSALRCVALRCVVPESGGRPLQVNRFSSLPKPGFSCRSWSVASWHSHPVIMESAIPYQPKTDTANQAVSLLSFFGHSSIRIWRHGDRHATLCQNHGH